MTETMTAAEYQAHGTKPPKVSKSEQIARTFALHIRARKLPEPRSRFHPEGELRFMAGEVIHRQNKRLKRRDASPAWRFDFAWPELMVAVEVEGVSVRKDATTGKTQLGGRHAHITGFKDDCEKYAWAAVMGWRVLRFEQSQVTSGFAVDMLVRMVAALATNGPGAAVMEALREHTPALELWKPYRVGDYWQCATPTGPYNFQAKDEADAQRICDRERASAGTYAQRHGTFTGELDFGGRDRDPF